MATDQLINKTQGDAIIAGLTAIKNAINDQPVPTQVEDVVSDAFDVGVSYVPGDYCIYENKLYKCDVAHHGAWDGNDFTLTNVGAELDALNNALNDVLTQSTTAKIVGRDVDGLPIYEKIFRGNSLTNQQILDASLTTSALKYYEVSGCAYDTATATLISIGFSVSSFSTSRTYFVLARVGATGLRAEISEMTIGRYYIKVKYSLN